MTLLRLALCVGLLFSASISLFAQQAGKGKSNHEDVDASAAESQAAIDPKSGKLRQPTPEEAKELADSLHQLVAQPVESLKPVPLENGAVAIDVSEGFETVALATVEADGSVKHACVTNKKEAEAFLKQKQNQPAAQPKAEALEEK